MDFLKICNQFSDFEHPHADEVVEEDILVKASELELVVWGDRGYIDNFVPVGLLSTIETSLRLVFSLLVKDLYEGIHLS